MTQERNDDIGKLMLASALRRM
ncbi:hypothetical protein BIW11_04573 [Tropilaelaps mercedesae]|uniref:Uncharacterized protein n=1 Tax=Tropilaelaps mercedesae TaxID=418985 RepID=A0A1V9X4R2_9ACAR|nr:hypothetical protein BIW11_04573 [Tropilaelaps mercedesae]